MKEVVGGKFEYVVMVVDVGKILFDTEQWRCINILYLNFLQGKGESGSKGTWMTTNQTQTRAFFKERVCV